jgi:hypothetical protein
MTRTTYIPDYHEKYRGFEINSGDYGFYAIRYEDEEAGRVEVELPGPSDECDTLEDMRGMVDEFMEGKDGNRD